MTQIRSVLTRANALAAAGILVFAAVLTAVPFQSASAGALINRSLMVTSTQAGDDITNGAGETVTDPGHPNNGAMVGHTYTFTPYTSGNTIQSLQMVYCNTPFGYLTGNCDGSVDADEGLPDGMDLTNATGAGTATATVYDSGGTPTGETDTFSVAFASTRDNVLEVTADAGGVAIAADDYVELEFDATAGNHFKNPEASYIGSGANQNPNGTYFVNITTYTDTLTTAVDNGTVTNSIADSISIETRVQEALNFSVEGDTSTDANPGAPTDPSTTCAPLTDGTAITMGDTNNALSSDTAYDAYSYFRLATNSANGAVVYYSGETLTSGGNTIDAAGGSEDQLSSPGSEQFGLAFDSTATGHSLSDLTTLAAAYDEGDGETNNPGPIVAEFGFETASLPTPVEIARSTNVVQCDTGAIRYIANISPDTEAGIYTTKINYIASPSY